MIVFYRQFVLLTVCLTFLLLAIQGVKAQSRILYSAMSSSGRIAVSDRKYIDIYDSDFVYQKTLTTISSDKVLSNIEMGWSPDGVMLVVQKDSYFASITQIWNVVTGTLLGEIQDTEFIGRSRFAWHPTSNALGVFVFVDEYIFEYRIYFIDGVLQNTWEKATHGGVQNIAWSPDGQNVVMTTTNELQLWDVESETIAFTLSQSPHFNAFVFSPDGRYIAFTDASYENSDRDIQIWQVDPLQYVMTLTGAQRSIYALSWTAQGVIAANNSGEVDVWNPDTGVLLKTFFLGDIFNEMQYWTADGTRILVSQRDDTLIIRDTLNGGILASLTHEEWLEQHPLETMTPQPTSSH